MYILGVICYVFFMTTDNIYEFISNVGNNSCPYSMATGEENYYLLAPNFKFIEKVKIEYDSILEGMFIEGKEKVFEELDLCEIYSNYD